MTQQDEKKIGETISQAVEKGQFISTETLENLQFENEVLCKLEEAEKEASLTIQRFSANEILLSVQQALKE